MWSDLSLFATPPQSVLDVYTKTAQSLSDLRKTKLANALQQIKLQYAPQREKADTDLAISNAAIKKSDAQYEPQFNAAELAQKHADTIYKRLQSQGAFLDNITKKAEADGAPAKVQAALAYQKALTKEALAHAEQYAGKAAGGGKGAPVYLDPETHQPIPGMTTDEALGNSPVSSPAAVQPQATSDNDSQDNTPAAPAAAPVAQTAAPQSVADATVAAAAQPEQTFPGANPKAKNVLAPGGITDSRGHPVAYTNLRTGERFAVLTPASRTQAWNQLGSIRQAIPYMDDLIKYGTIGKFEHGGLSQLLPESVGGVSRADAVRYNAILKQSVEHVINGSKLKQTETTLPMIHAVLERQPAESREAYKDRILTYKAHLIDLEKNIANAAGSGLGSVDRYTQDAEQKYFENEYKKLKAKGAGDSSGFVRMRSPNGKIYRVPSSEVNDAMKNKYKRIE